jgi:hypothetical protein
MKKNLIRTGTVGLAAGFVLAILGAFLSVQFESTPKAAALTLHRFGQIVMLLGFFIILGGYRIEWYLEQWQNAKVRRLLITFSEIYLPFLVVIIEFFLVPQVYPDWLAVVVGVCAFLLGRFCLMVWSTFLPAVEPSGMEQFCSLPV